MRIYLSRPQQALPQYAQLGFNTVATDTGEWRVFSLLAGERVLQVAQPMSVRRELAASMALRTIVPLLALVPLVALLVWLSIARGCARLREVATAVARRSPHSLDPVAEAGLPAEIRPLVHALERPARTARPRAGRAARLRRRRGARAAHAAHRGATCRCSSPSARRPTPSAARRSPRSSWASPARRTWSSSC